MARGICDDCEKPGDRCTCSPVPFKTHRSRNKLISVPQRIGELVLRHGGVRAAARAIRVDAGYLQRLYTGEKRNPSDATLRKLGMLPCPFYLRDRRYA